MKRQIVIHITLAFLIALASFPAMGAESTPITGSSEELLLSWPVEEGWTIGTRHEDQTLKTIEYIRKGETPDNWTEIGSMISSKGEVLQDIRIAYEKYAALSVQTCPDVRLAILFSEPKAEFPRLIFMQECTRMPKDHSEAWVWLIVQGKQSLYVVNRARKAETLPGEVRSKWIEWLKTARVVQQ